MNRNKHDQEKLLAETFHGDWSSGPAAAFAQRAAREARRSRNLRSALTFSAAAAGVAIALFFTSRPLSPPLPSSNAIVKTGPAFEIISDDELIAQLKDRPLLVQSRPDGSREIVLLEN